MASASAVERAREREPALARASRLAPRALAVLLAALLLAGAGIAGERLALRALEAPAAAIAALALAIAALAARAARFERLARAAGAASSPAALTGTHVAARALDRFAFPLVGTAAQTAILARRGAGVRRALGVAALLLALDLAGLLALAALALVALHAWPLPGYLALPARALALAAVAVGIGVLALAPRWRLASRRLLSAARAAPVVALTLAALVLEAAALATGAIAAGVEPATALPAGLIALADAASPAHGLLLGDAGDAMRLAALSFASAARFEIADAGASALALAPLALAAVALSAWAARPAAAAWTREDAALLRSPRARLALVLGFALAVRLAEWRPAIAFAGRDSHAHGEYVRAVLAGNLVPHASDFFMAYHPPLWYWVAAPAFAALGLAGLTLLDVGLSLGALVVLHALLARVGVPERARLVALAVAACVPGFLLASLIASNDAAAALAGGLVVLLALPFLDEGASARDGVALGLATGAGLLVKANVAVVALAVGAAVLVARRGRVGAPAWIALGLATALAGWWYARNALLYGSLFVSNVEFFDALGVPRAGERASGAPDFGALVPSLGVLSSPRGDVWSRLLETAFFPALPPLRHPLALLAPGAARAAFLLVGVALAALVAVGAARALARGTRADRALAVVALAALASQLAYFLAYPVAWAVQFEYLLPAFPAMVALAARGPALCARR